jgi:hypothetical protein
MPVVHAPGDPPRSSRRTATRLIVAAGVAALLVVAAGSAQADSRAGTVVVTITRGGLEVAPVNVLAGTLLFKIANHAKVARDFAIGGKRTAQIPPGTSATLTVALTAGFQTYSSMRLSHRGRITGLLDALAPCADPAATTVTVHMTQEPGGIALSQNRIPCGTVTFVVTNVGALTDALWVFGTLPREKGVTPEIASGQTASLTIQFVATGIVYYESGDFPPAEPEYGGDSGEQGLFTIT